MRFDGTLKSWNAERGFGFIKPSQGGQDIFAHISAFPRGGCAPCEGESLSFEVEVTPDGKKRAMRVQRPGIPVAVSRESRRRVATSRGSGFRVTVLGLVFLGVLGWYGYEKFQRKTVAHVAAEVPTAVAGGAIAPLVRFQCDGRTHCSQMTSCAEAKFFLQNCPGTKMDGNNDGVPCEQQWCTSPQAR